MIAAFLRASHGTANSEFHGTANSEFHGTANSEFHGTANSEFHGLKHHLAKVQREKGLFQIVLQQRKPFSYC